MSKHTKRVVGALALALAAAYFVPPAARGQAIEGDGKRWANILLSPSCQYPCGSNTGHPNCSCQ